MGKMKDLDKSKVYYLGDLSDEQLDQVCEWLKINDIDWGGYGLNLIKNRKRNNLYYCVNEWVANFIFENKNTTNALELFEDETETIPPIEDVKINIESISQEDKIQDNKELSNIFKKESILQEAEKIINGVRAEDYGDVEENFTRIADGWKVIFGIENISPRQVAHAMTWLKICRDLNTPKRDNLVDICGYTGCIDKMENKEKV